MKLSGKIVVLILGSYFLVSLPYLLLSVFINVYNVVFSLTTNTPSLYGNLLAGVWLWRAILIAGVGVYLIKISRRDIFDYWNRNVNSWDIFTERNNIH